MDEATITFITVIAIGITILTIFNLIKITTITTINDKVTDKWVKNYDGESKYLIATENNGVLKNTDEIIVWKFNSSDIYAKIQIGKEYELKIIGWRIPLLSFYKNIISVRELNE